MNKVSPTHDQNIKTLSCREQQRMAIYRWLLNEEILMIENLKVQGESVHS